MFGRELRLPIDAMRAGVAADLDPPPPVQIWTPYQTFLLSIVRIILGN